MILQSGVRDLTLMKKIWQRYLEICLILQSNCAFSCASEEAVSNRILGTVREGIRTSRSKYNWNAFTDIDEEVICPGSHEGIRNSDAAEIRKGNTLLHNLHHGTIENGAMDFLGGGCRQWIAYEGYSDSLYCLNKIHEFTRELLDAWLWDL